MPIKFPRMHVAESVVNRILNAADDIERTMPRSSPAPAVSPVPTVPDATLEGEQLEAALRIPTPENLPAIDDAPNPGATAAGVPLLDTMLQPKE